MPYARPRARVRVRVSTCPSLRLGLGLGFRVPCLPPAPCARAIAAARGFLELLGLGLVPALHSG
eukprot:scaffold11472_cov82-Phaeocystis_antarctica.AAC.2